MSTDFHTCPHFNLYYREQLAWKALKSDNNFTTKHPSQGMDKPSDLAFVIVQGGRHKSGRMFASLNLSGCSRHY